MKLKKLALFFVILLANGLIVAQVKPKQKQVLTKKTESSTQKEKMSRKQIKEEILKLIVENLGVNIKDLTEKKSFEDDLGADSLDQIELVMAIEDNFSIYIADEDAENVKTVGQAIDLVYKLVNK